MSFFAKLFGRRTKSAEADAQAKKGDEPRHPLVGPTAGWKPVKDGGQYQAVLRGKAPRIVNVELMPWVRGNTVSVRINGKRAGEVWSKGPVHEALLARREAGMPNLVIKGEVRLGDITPFYLAIDWPSDDQAAEIAPQEG